MSIEYVSFLQQVRLLLESMPPEKAAEEIHKLTLAELHGERKQMAYHIRACAHEKDASFEKMAREIEEPGLKYATVREDPFSLQTRQKAEAFLQPRGQRYIVCSATSEIEQVVDKMPITEGDKADFKSHARLFLRMLLRRIDGNVSLTTFSGM